MTGATPRAEKAESTRRSIVAAARELFAERGYEATPIADVLTTAGVSRGALYHHFDGKEALFEAVFEAQEQDVADRIAVQALAETDPVEQIRRGGAAWLEATMDPAVRRISVIDAPNALGWQRWREIDERYGFGLLKAALLAAADAGRMRAESVDVVAHMLLAVLGEAAMVVARAEDPVAALRESEEMFGRVVDAAVGRPRRRR